MKCLRCNTRNATSGALCEPCREALRNLATLERAQGNAQVIAQINAQAQAPKVAKRTRTEWKEAV